MKGRGAEMGNSRWRGSAKDGEKKKARLIKWYICLSVYLSGYRSENLSQCMTFGEKKDTQLLGYPLFEIAASQLPLHISHRSLLEFILLLYHNLARDEITILPCHTTGQNIPAQDPPYLHLEPLANSSFPT